MPQKINRAHFLVKRHSYVFPRWSIFGCYMFYHTAFLLGERYTLMPAYLTYMQIISWEILGWKKHKLESRPTGEVSITSIMQMISPFCRKWRGTKKPLDESERVEWKRWLKAQHSENEDHGICSHHFMGKRWANSGNSVRLHFFGFRNHCRWWLQPWKWKTLTFWKESYDQPR